MLVALAAPHLRGQAPTIQSHPMGMRWDLPQGDGRYPSKRSWAAAEQPDGLEEAGVPRDGEAQGTPSPPRASLSPSKGRTHLGSLCHALVCRKKKSRDQPLHGVGTASGPGVGFAPAHPSEDPHLCPEALGAEPRCPDM